ncbi:DUF692 domain-containing protein [Agarivorans gilvus]|uniref:UPF0276 protein RB0508 n=1 Tax=Agarivorans gilvus TaxID=680279 RepID=A0ABQ1I8D1_9ALTE|nr:DUF692 domain-containing protein [Agarivorans gilvus]GGB21260.1 UPF0276 protein RB0508 [Agarivorans gilvus]
MTVLTQSSLEALGNSPVGVGLRHEHYNFALEPSSPSIDFVEVHAENFFAKGGATSYLLDQVAERYPVSIHGTSMGLGSGVSINDQYLKNFARLVNRIKPFLISDHACFTWGNLTNEPVHAGDLLPLQFDRATLQALSDNVDRVQQLLGRQILVENIVSYKSFAHNDFSETEFFSRLVENTQCGLLVDLNNLLVNFKNFPVGKPIEVAKQWLTEVPSDAVKELHLAGSSEPAPGAMIVDDHAQAVSDECWLLFYEAIKRFPEAAVLLEWDNNLPAWDELISEARKANGWMNRLKTELI